MKISKTQVIVIGSGIAGLYASIKLAENNRHVLLITKSNLRESNSRYAQGGIVAVLPQNHDDSVGLHVKDTLKAGAGLTEESVAKFISENSYDAIKDLISYGVPFDKDDSDKISLTLEAAHSTRRILHAGGDATGKSIEVALSNIVEENTNITIYEKTQVVDLLVNKNNICTGAILFNIETNEYETVYASAVIMAAGGVGQIYSNTTNPQIATGDGIALGYRANAVIQDVEFVQFHPTALTFMDNGTRFLISESVRGEGAKLKNSNKETFTHKYDKRGDLAPRDIVARAIISEMNINNDSHVYLDTTLIDKSKLAKRFPNIIKACKDNGMDISKTMIPVSPAAHFMMGGLKVVKTGQTSVSGLFAVGESSCTSLHGANRLASNSLLECVVTSKQVAEYLNSIQLSNDVNTDEQVQSIIDIYDSPLSTSTSDVAFLTKELKNSMWENAGIERTEKKLSSALEVIDEIKRKFNKDYKCANIKEYELRNMLTVAELIVKCALARKESRGAHYRSDYPEADSVAYHSYIRIKDFAVKNVLSFS